MPTETPLIDPRTYAELVHQLAELAKRYTAAPGRAGWQPPGDGDPDLGWALIRLFGRLAEIAVARLNRVPEKSFLAFLDLIGARPGPAQPARVPLTFHLAPGSPGDALVPAGTQVAALPPAGEKAPVLFETERDLVVTRSQLTAVLVHEPDRDYWSDRTDVATGLADGAFDPFQGETPIEHALYLGHAAVLGEPPVKDVILSITATGFDALWWSAVAWEVWDGGGWAKIAGNRLEIESQPGSPTVWTVTLKAVPPVPPSTVAGRAANWLRIRLTTPLPHGAPGPLPTVTDIKMSFHLKREDEDALTPDLGFSNQLPIDFKKDFFPFGEKPRVGDALYLASDEAFARPGATVTLKVVPTNASNATGSPPPAAPADDLKLEWQAWNGHDWRTFGTSAKDAPSSASFTDGTNRFQGEGKVTFLCPDVQPVAIGGVTRRFVRVRIAQGGYGVDVSYAPVTVPVFSSFEASPAVDAAAASLQAVERTTVASSDLSKVALATTPAAVPTQVYLFVPATFRPPSLSSLRLGYSYSSPAVEPPQALLTVNDFTVWPPLPPPRFRDLAIPFPIDVSSFTAFARLAGTQPARPSVSPPAAGFTPFVPPVETRPTLYLGFARPGDAAGFANRATELYFAVEERLFDPAVGPSAMAEAAAVVWEHWDGAAWQRLGVRDETRGFAERGLVTFVGPPVFPRSRQLGRDAFWLRGRWERGAYDRRPRLGRVLLNTTWAVHATTLAGETLGASRGTPGQVFATRRAPVLPGQRLEVRELAHPSPDELATLAAEEGDAAVRVVPATAGGTEAVWVRWHEVPDFLASGPRSRHYTFDRASGEARFGDGRRGLIPPPGTGNVVMARYQVGGGPDGNRPAGSITQIKGTVPYVATVSHDEPAAGGAPAESLAALRVHGPKVLRHRGRATALDDFADLAFQASPLVARAQPIGAHDAGDAGTVGLLIVPSSTEPQPIPSLELLERVRAYVAARLSPVVDLWLAGPDWLPVTVEAEIVPRVLEQATDVQNAVRARLAEFLHPLTGGPGGDGWAFGRKPYRSDLSAVIAATPGIDHVRLLKVTETVAPGEVLRPGRFLIFSGEHRITLSGELDAAAASGSAP